LKSTAPPKPGESTFLYDSWVVKVTYLEQPNPNFVETPGPAAQVMTMWRKADDSGWTDSPEGIAFPSDSYSISWEVLTEWAESQHVDEIGQRLAKHFKG